MRQWLGVQDRNKNDLYLEGVEDCRDIYCDNTVHLEYCLLLPLPGFHGSPFGVNYYLERLDLSGYFDPAGYCQDGDGTGTPRHVV